MCSSGARTSWQPRNKTKLTAHLVFQSVLDRDGMVASGMRDGADESMERLAELLAKQS